METNRAHSRRQYLALRSLDNKLPRLSSVKNPFLNELVTGRDELCNCIISLLLSDYSYATSKNVEGILWRSVFHRPIEAVRRLRNSEEVASFKKNYYDFLSDSIALFQDLLPELIQRNRVPSVNPDVLSTSPKDCSEFTGIYHLQMYLGDLLRYQAMDNPSLVLSNRTRLDAAASMYISAWRLLPQEGHPHNQLAVIATINKNKFESMYRYSRASHALSPFRPSEKNLTSLQSKLISDAVISFRPRFKMIPFESEYTCFDKMVRVLMVFVSICSMVCVGDQTFSLSLSSSATSVLGKQFIDLLEEHLQTSSFSKTDDHSFMMILVVLISVENRLRRKEGAMETYRNLAELLLNIFCTCASFCSRGYLSDARNYWMTRNCLALCAVEAQCWSDDFITHLYSSHVGLSSLFETCLDELRNLHDVVGRSYIIRNQVSEETVEYLPQELELAGFSPYVLSRADRVTVNLQDEWWKRSSLNFDESWTRAGFEGACITRTWICLNSIESCLPTCSPRKTEFGRTKELDDDDDDDDECVLFSPQSDISTKDTIVGSTTPIGQILQPSASLWPFFNEKS